MCDILCLNQSEASILTSINVNTIDDGIRCCGILKEKGCGTVILTMGEKGAIFTDDAHKCLHVPIKEEINPIDTTVRFFIYYMCYILI